MFRNLVIFKSKFQKFRLNLENCDQELATDFPDLRYQQISNNFSSSLSRTNLSHISDNRRAKRKQTAAALIKRSDSYAFSNFVVN